MPLLTRKEKMYIIMIILIMGTMSFYYVLSRIQLHIETAQHGQDRCVVDLDQAKYQLSVISDYKNRIEKVLTDTKKAYDGDKSRFRDIMDSCVAMKQQCNFCQIQFEDLQSECRSVKEQLTQALKKLEQWKTNKSGG